MATILWSIAIIAFVTEKVLKVMLKRDEEKLYQEIKAMSEEAIQSKSEQ